MTTTRRDFLALLGGAVVMPGVLLEDEVAFESVLDVKVNNECSRKAPRLGGYAVITAITTTELVLQEPERRYGPDEITRAVLSANCSPEKVVGRLGSKFYSPHPGYKIEARVRGFQPDLELGHLVTFSFYDGSVVSDCMRVTSIWRSLQ